MDKNGDVMQLSSPGPSGGILVLVSDYANKIVTLVEIVPNAPPARRIVVWEVQSYLVVAG